MQEVDITSPNTDNVADNTETHTDTDDVACDLSQRLEAARTTETMRTSAVSTTHIVEVLALKIAPMYAVFVNRSLMQVAVSDICVNVCSLSNPMRGKNYWHMFLLVQLRSTMLYTA